MEATCSIQKGYGSLLHNDRTIENQDIKNRSWNPELSDQNYIMVNKSLKKMYKELFGESTKKYNQKQVENGHSERQIKNYYEKISHSKQEKLFHEIVVEVGNTDSIKKGSPEEEIVRKALREYCQNFEERNPNFKVVQMIEHNDENMICHTHIDFIPISHGNKRGLETKNSLSGALKEMGFGRSKSSFSQWRAKEEETLIKIMQKYDIQYIRAENDLPHMSIAQYKETMKIVSQEAQKKLSEIKAPEPEVKVHPLTKKRSVTLSETEYKDLMMVHALETEKLKADNEVLLAEKEIRDQKLRNMTTKAYVIENERLEKQVQDLSKENLDLKEDIDILEEEKQDLQKEIEPLKTENKKLKTENLRLETEVNWFYEVIYKVMNFVQEIPEKLQEQFVRHVSLRNYTEMESIHQEQKQAHKMHRGMGR